MFRTVAITVSGAREVKLLLKPTKLGRKRLARKGRLKVKALVTFSPAGGTPRSSTRTVVFKLRRAGALGNATNRRHARSHVLTEPL